MTLTAPMRFSPNVESMQPDEPDTVEAHSVAFRATFNRCPMHEPSGDGTLRHALDRSISLA